MDKALVEFDTGVNPDFIRDKYDTQNSVISTITGGAVATLVDIGASLWNSLPGTEEVDTLNLLSRIDNNALRVYEENPDAINTASFIGGIFVPGSIAFKGMKAARNGSKAVNWFTQAGKEADMKAIDTLFKAGKDGTREMREAMRGYYLKGAANQVVDALAAEAAIIATLNAHPFMEDYLEDPMKNFAISMAFGSVLGSGIGHIADRFAVRSMNAATMAGAINTVEDPLRKISSTMTPATAIQSIDINTQTLEAMARAGREEGKDITNDLTMQLVDNALLHQRAEKNKIFQEMVSSDLYASWDDATRAEFETLFSQNTKFHGVSKLRPATSKEVNGIGIAPSGTKAASIEDVEPSFQKTVVSKAGIAATKQIEVAYLPELGIHAPMKELPHYAGAASLGKTTEQLAKDQGWNFGKVANHDAALEKISMSTAEAEAKSIGTIARVAKMNVEEIQKLIIAPSDIDLQIAVASRLKELPDGYKVKVKIADTTTVQKKLLDDQGIDVGKRLNPDGRPVDYAKAVDAFTSPEALKKNAFWDYAEDYAKLPLNSESERMMMGWINGSGVADMRKAASDYFGRGFAAGAKLGNAQAEAFGHIYNHPFNTQLRENFRKLADANGQVLLYRGSKAEKQKGQAILESFTTDPKKAAEFGTPRLYRVDVDDIVAGFLDISNSAGIRRNEIIVAATARPVEAVLDKTGRAKFLNSPPVPSNPSLAPGLVSNNKEVFLSDLMENIYREKGMQIDSMLDAGTPFVTIAKKTNTPIETVEAYAVARSTESFEDLVGVGYKPIAINSVSEAENALAPKNKPIIMAGDPRKVSYTSGHSNLNIEDFRKIDDEFKATVLFNSKSQHVRAIGQLVYNEYKKPLDMARMSLGWVNNWAAGNAFFGSVEHYARNMKDMGVVASNIGKRIEKLSNDEINRLMVPISEKMTAVTKNELARYEANLIYNTNQGLSGYRIYDPSSRTLYQLEDTIRADGKLVQTSKPVTYATGEIATVKTDEVHNMLIAMQEAGKDMLAAKNARNKILGIAPVNDIGLWIPTFSPINKNIAYVYQRSTGQTRLLVANSEEGIKQQKLDYEKYLKERGVINDYQVFLKSDQEAISRLNGRLDDNLFMTLADTSMLKSGQTARAIQPMNLDIFSDIAAGYEHAITANTRRLAELAMSDIMDSLDRLSAWNKRGFNNQPMTIIDKALKKPEDSAAIIRNTMLGDSNLKEYSGWSNINVGFETTLAFAATNLTKAFQAVTSPFTRKGQILPESLAKVDYEAFAKRLEEAGIPNVYAQFDTAAAQFFQVAKLEDAKNISKRLVYGGNALSATMILRFGEIAQPIVNAVSLPILATLNAAATMPSTFLGAKLNTAKVAPMQVMYEGIRALNSPVMEQLNKRWADLGYFDAIVSEANSVMRAARSFDGSITAKIENALDSEIVKWASWTADKSEQFGRKIMMNTGYMLGKRLYPELDDAALTIFARDFLDKSIGNFHASQRPVMFQGTAGVAMGLFQTYILTLGQSIYRNLELKNYKALGKGALVQAGMFGTQSLPGFHPISEAIGEHFSDDNFDLTTGTYRALPDDLANFLLYGMPSNLGPALFTRGDISVRPPNLLAGAENIVAINTVKQAMTTGGEMVRALSQDNADVGRAFLQALSLQSISRPLARGAEIATGYSIDRAGQNVQTPEEVWSFWGVTARLMSTRPFEEAVIRQANHLDNYYGAADRDARQRVTQALRTAIRNETLTDEKISSLAEDYFRKNGTPNGWRTAVQEAIHRTETNRKEHLTDKLKENSPLNFMIASLE